MLELRRKPEQNLTEIQRSLGDAGARFHLATVQRGVEALQRHGLVDSRYVYKRQAERRCHLTARGAVYVRRLQAVIARLWSVDLPRSEPGTEKKEN